MRLETRKAWEDGLTAKLHLGGDIRPEGQARVTAVDTLDGLRTKPLRELLSYWERLCAGRMAPSRADIRPADIPRILPHLLLLDVLESGMDFHIRLMGTHVVNGLGADLTGRYLSEVAGGGDENPMLTLARQAVETRVPNILGYRRLRPSGRLVILSEAIALPLSENGRDIDRILAGLSLIPRSNTGPLATGAIER